MSTEIVLIKQTNGLFAASEYDYKKLRQIEEGKPIKINFISWKDRSLQHHRLYFGGLLKLVSDYWTPGSYITSGEKATLKKFSYWLGKKGGNTDALINAMKTYLSELSAHRSNSIELPPADLSVLNDWVKVQAGYYDLVSIPSGLRKQPRSINFNSMDQDEFNCFYKAAFSVCWRFILFRAFENEQQAQNAVDQLLAMG